MQRGKLEENVMLVNDVRGVCLQVEKAQFGNALAASNSEQDNFKRTRRRLT